MTPEVAWALFPVWTLGVGLYVRWASDRARGL